MNIKISIVIPVYNTKKKHIQSCLNSLFNQTYHDWECVFVDNGSNVDYSEFFTDDRIKYTRLEENQGIFLARKHGTINASGDYVIFCDSDDYLDKDLCMNASQHFNPDIDVFITKTTSVFEYGRKEFSIWANSDLDMAETNGFFESLCSRTMIPWTIWGKVIKRSILLEAYKDIHNDFPICMGEDFLLTTCYGYLVKKAKYLPVNGYYHTMNTQSTSLSISKIEKLERHLEDINAISLALDQYFIAKNVSLETLNSLKKELLASFLIDTPKFKTINSLYTEIMPRLTKIFGDQLVYEALIDSYTVRADSLYWNTSKLFMKIFPQNSFQYRTLRSIIVFFYNLIKK